MSQPARLERLERLQDYLSGNGRLTRTLTRTAQGRGHLSKPWQETTLTDQKQFLLETPHVLEYSLHFCLLVVSTTARDNTISPKNQHILFSIILFLRESLHYCQNKGALLGPVNRHARDIS